jgi:hypothetical protein
LLTPDRYVQVRLGDQLSYFKRRAVKLERQLKLIQWSIYIIGGLGTLLAAINQQVWIAVTTAVAAALTTYLSYRQTENTLTKYNQSSTDLENVKSWWMALPGEEQEKQINLDALVDHTEKVLQSELDGWVQQMQDALAELRKGQEKAPEREEPQNSPTPAAVEGAAVTESPAQPDATAGDGNIETPAEPEIASDEASQPESDADDENSEAAPPEPDTDPPTGDEPAPEPDGTGDNSVGVGS